MLEPSSNIEYSSMLFDRKQQTAIPIKIPVSIAKWQVVFAVPRWQCCESLTNIFVRGTVSITKTTRNYSCY